MTPTRTGRGSAAMTVAAQLFPEITVGMLLVGLARDRVRGQDSERGDAVQWVIIAAIAAAMAVTVGTIIYTKMRDKANGITTDTPAIGS